MAGPRQTPMCRWKSSARPSVPTLDRKTVTQYIKDNTFDTIMGPISFEDQISNKYWTVGQWQDGKFRGVKSSQMDGAASSCQGRLELILT